MMHCPSCGHEIHTRAPVESLAGAPFRRQQRVVVDALAEAYPRPVEIGKLVDAVYGHDPNGGPDIAGKAITSIVEHLRQKLSTYGWTIPKTTKGIGQKGRYRLEPIETIAKIRNGGKA